MFYVGKERMKTSLNLGPWCYSFDGSIIDSNYGCLSFVLTKIITSWLMESMKIMKMNVLLLLNAEIINRSFPVNQFLALTMIEVYHEEFCLRPRVSIWFMHCLWISHLHILHLMSMSSYYWEHRIQILTAEASLKRNYLCIANVNWIAGYTTLCV